MSGAPLKITNAVIEVQSCCGGPVGLKLHHGGLPLLIELTVHDAMELAVAIVDAVVPPNPAAPVDPFEDFKPGGTD